jgi:ribosome-binding protein aMBF1 (putative translation factor)
MADKEIRIMNTKTCAACDCELDAAPIIVKVGGNTVEVCCEDCALALKEAYATSSDAQTAQKT